MAGHRIRAKVATNTGAEDYAVGIADTARAIRSVLDYCGADEAWSICALSDEELWTVWGVGKGELKRIDER